MGQDTARAAGRVLNPQEYVAEEFARAGKDRTAQVGNCMGWGECGVCRREALYVLCLWESLVQST